MLNKILTVLKFIGKVIPFVSRFCQDTKPLIDALDEVDSLKPIKKSKSWRDRLSK